MKYVLDASVAVKWVLPEPDSDSALLIEAGYRAGAHELIAPDLLYAEIAHVLTKAERRKLLLPGQAANRLTQLLVYPVELHSHFPMLPLAVALASQARIGVYDCLYVALAEQQLCEVVSADMKLVNAFPGRVVPLSSI